MRLQPWVAAAGDLLLGACRHGCGRPWWGVCPSCLASLRGHRPYLTQPDPCPPDLPPTVTCSPYDDLLRGLVSAHKERGALGLGPLLADRLAQSVHGLLENLHPEHRLARGLADDGRLGRGVVRGPVLLVPVPSAAAAVRRRGYDATWTLARLAARQLQGRHAVRAARLLSQRAGLADQSALDAAARQANLAGGLRLRAGAAAEIRTWAPTLPRVVLVDDLITTGSSLGEAARVLVRADLSVLGAATVAATERRAPGPPPGSLGDSTGR